MEEEEVKINKIQIFIMILFFVFQWFDIIDWFINIHFKVRDIMILTWFLKLSLKKCENKYIATTSYN